MDAKGEKVLGRHHEDVRGRVIQAGGAV
jgi:hypothetical protein